MAGGSPELLEAAARHLDRGEHAECEKKAKKAAEALSAAGDASGNADALRLVVLCYCQQGRRKEAAHLAEEEWAKFRETDAKLAEAKMLLALSEANSIKRGPKKRAEALRTATDALRIFRELGDKRMQGAVLLILVNVYLKGVPSGSRQKNQQDAVELAREALSLFQIADDKRLQAEAMHTLAATRIQTGSFEAGLRHAKDALRTYQELGMTRSEVCENQCIAEWLLGAGMAKQAQPYAEEALAICRQLGCDSAWEASAVGTVVHALLARTEVKKAEKLVSEALVKFQEDQDKQGEAFMLDLKITVHLAQGNPREALHAAEQALKVAKDLGNKKHESMLQRTASRLHLKLQEPDQALEAAKSALAAAQKLGSADRTAAAGCVAEAHGAAQDPAAALQAVSDEREALHRAGDGRGEAIAALLTAGLHAEAGDGQRAATLASEARTLFRDAGDARGQAAALQLGAQVHTVGGRHEAAQRLVREALPLMREIGDSKGQASMLVLDAQASILSLLNAELDPSTFRFSDIADKATQLAKEAVSIARKSGDSSIVGSALCALAQAHLLMTKSKDAVQAASSAVAIFRGAGDQHGEAYALLLNASGLLTTDKKEKAREAAGKAQAIFLKFQDARGRALAEHAIDVIDNPPDLDQEGLFEGYGDLAVAARSSAAASASPQTAMVNAALKQSVRHTVEDIVGLDDIQDDTPLMQTGLTSQSAVLLRNALTKEFPGPSLPFTMMFDYPSIAHLTEFFMTRGGR